MRTQILSKLMWLGVGTGIAALMFGKRRAPKSDDFSVDPADPVQDPDVVDAVDPLDDLDVDAMSMLDRDVDVETQTYLTTSGENDAPDSGDLDDGQNWIEALNTSAAENGPRPEQSLDSVIDDSDLYAPHRAGDNDDTPVADRGSGGPAGM